MTVALCLFGVLLTVTFGALLVVGVLRYNRIFRATPPQTWPSILQLQRAGLGAAMARLERLGIAGRAKPSSPKSSPVG